MTSATSNRMKDNIEKRKIELLAPAKDAEIAIEAIKHGADAVYIGAESHGARAAAGNSVADIARVVEFAHGFNARVYVTVNTIIYDDELADVERLIIDLYRVGVDALIVQDMAVLRMNIPPIALHASTQCDTRDVAKAQFLQQAGFSRIVLARELSLQEISDIHKNVDVPLEAFVHGALCVSYSGDCQASCLALGRSANRGECAQMCRLLYSLIDANGQVLLADKHLLSLRDMNRSGHIAAMMDAGVSSFKIEGRLKDIGYVKNVVAYYRKAIDAVIEANPEKYCRLSAGNISLNFTPILDKSFNRGFTSYFLNGRDKKEKIASIDTPKSQGEVIGRVKTTQGNRIVASLDKPLNNGDGLVFFDARGQFNGFRLNRVDGNILYPANPINIPSGTILYRNKDKKWDDLLARESARRFIEIAMRLRVIDNGIALDITDSRGNSVTSTMIMELSPAKSEQIDARNRILTKTGGTIYCVSHIDDEAGNIFIPASRLADLRRDALELLDRAQRLSYQFDYRCKESADLSLPQGSRLSYHDNVANRLAADFYHSHGAIEIESAIELAGKNRAPETVVMTSRYCLRRELGYCLKTSAGKAWKSPLFIKSDYAKYRLDFDCSNCQMKVVYICDVDKNP